MSRILGSEVLIHVGLGCVDQVELFSPKPLGREPVVSSCEWFLTCATRLVVDPSQFELHGII